MLVATIKTDFPSLDTRVPEDRKNLLKKTQHKPLDNCLDSIPHITVTSVEVIDLPPFLAVALSSVWTGEKYVQWIWCSKNFHNSPIYHP